MEGGRGFRGGCHDMIYSNNSLWLPSSSSSSFPEPITMMNFDQEPQQGVMAIPKKDLSKRWTSELEVIGGDDSDANPNSEKKRRLTHDQAQFLEKSFEIDNKLEPERKVLLAKQVGLQPRQVAIWFQNRRARYKTKQIEKEFDSLKANYERLKVDYDSLTLEKEYLKNEVEVLNKKLAGKQAKELYWNPNNTVQYDKGGMPYTQANGNVGIADSGLVGIQSLKHTEEANSAKSDIFDSESPYCTDGNQGPAVLEACSNPMRGLDQLSDFLHDEQMMMNKNLLLPQSPPTFNNLLNVPDTQNYDPNANSCNFSSLVDDQPWSWLY